MFDFTTILTLIAPAVIAPLGCLAILKAIGRAEARRRTRAPAPVEVVVDRAAPPAAEPTRARQVA